MQKLKFLIPFALLICAFFVACHEEDPIQAIEKKATVAFAGQIIDENGDGVPGALVKAGEKSMLTDKNGVFRLESVELPANHAILSVTSAGFFDFSRAYVVKDNALQTVTIQLLTKELAGQFNATAGGVINISGGPKLSFPTNAIVDQNGNAYTGAVNVLAKYLDPKSKELYLFMPGNLTGLNLAGERQSLSTFGMVQVELESPSGQKLQIAGNSEVEMRAPIDASIAANAPAEVPLWHFDLEKAYWIEEGLAQKIGNEYVGKVKHFSCWNYDGSLPSIILSGSVFIDDLDHPLTGVHVSVSPADPADGWACGHGCPDGNGSFGGAVPKDVLLKIEINWWDQCGPQILYSAQIGPFSSDATLPPIILASQSLDILTVSGRLVDCNGQPLTNGYAKMIVDGTNSFVFADANGDFVLNSFLCPGASQQSGTITGYDLDNLLESPAIPFLFPPSTVNVGDISACNVLSEYVRFTLDGGQEIVKIAPFAGLDAGATFISTQDSSSANQNLQMSFANNAQVGTYPLQSLIVNSLTANNMGTLTTTVTPQGPNIGDLIIGSFSGNFQTANGDNHSVTGNYRVKRSW